MKKRSGAKTNRKERFTYERAAEIISSGDNWNTHDLIACIFKNTEPDCPMGLRLGRLAEALIKNGKLSAFCVGTVIERASITVVMGEFKHGLNRRWTRRQK